MRRSITAAAAVGTVTCLGLGLAVAVTGTGTAASTSSTLEPGDTLSVVCTGNKLMVVQPTDTTASLTCSRLETPTPPPTDPTTTPPPATDTATPTPTPTSPAPTPSGEAATAFGWGQPIAGDEFNYTGAPDSTKWSVYNSAGHNGKGLRSPSTWTVNGSAAQVSGDSAGTTGGMSAKFGRQKYGRWETRMRTSDRDPKYHPVLLLWPDSGTWPCGGELDYAEGTSDTALMHFFQHYSCSNSQTTAQKTVDTTQWHNYAVQWSPSGVTGWVDGVQWFHDADTSHLPPESMHETIQLDWFPVSGQATKPSWMQVDWTRVYNMTATGPVPSATSTPTQTTTTPTPTPTTTPPATGGDVVIAAVGDQNPSGNSSTSSNSAKVAASIAADNPTAVLSLGDHQYTYGTCSAFLSGYDKLWGRFNSKLYSTAGPTHDFDATNSNGQQYGPYMSGTCAGQTSGKTAGAVAAGGTLKPTDGYSFDKGNWHIVQLPSGCMRYTGLCDKTALLAWLNKDLDAANAAGKHTAAFWHEPYWTAATAEHSTTEGDYTKPFNDAIAAHGVRLVLNGHQHGYQHFYPQTGAGVRNDATGIEEFVVGTGGIGFYPFSSTAPNTKARSSDTYGWLRLVLHADGGYDYRFVRAAGGTFTDTGTRAP